MIVPSAFVFLDNQQEIFLAHGIAAWKDQTTPIEFTNIDANIGQSFNGTHFQPRRNGIFIFLISSAVPSSGVLNVTLLDNAGVRVTSLSLYVAGSKRPTPFSTFQLVRLQQTQSVCAVSETPLHNISNAQQWPTTIMGFRADESTMSPFVAWQNTFTRYVMTSDQIVKVSKNSTFNTDQFNENWNAKMFKRNIIRVPVDGIYIVSMTATLIGPKANVYSWILFRLNQTFIKVESNYPKSVKYDNLMLTLFYLVRMTAIRDELVMRALLPGYGTLSVTVMLYSPVSSAAKIAWSIELTFMVSGSICNIAVMENVDVNCCEKCPDQNNSRVAVKQDGLYYIALIMNSFQSNYDCIRLHRVNGTADNILCILAADGERKLPPLDFVNAQRSTIMRLSAGDYFKFLTDINLAWHSKRPRYKDKQMMFVGFALY